VYRCNDCLGRTFNELYFILAQPKKPWRSIDSPIKRRRHSTARSMLTLGSANRAQESAYLGRSHLRAYIRPSGNRMQRNINTSARQADRLGYEAAMWNMGWIHSQSISRGPRPQTLFNLLSCAPGRKTLETRVLQHEWRLPSCYMVLDDYMDRYHHSFAASRELATPNIFSAD
jgi:hypothetical protein